MKKLGFTLATIVALGFATQASAITIVEEPIIVPHVAEEPVVSPTVTTTEETAINAARTTTMIAAVNASHNHTSLDDTNTKTDIGAYVPFTLATLGVLLIVVFAVAI